MSSASSLEGLQTRWKYLYSTRLPALAKAKDPAQPRWPVQIDHCFARIILDNAIGKDRPWAQVVKSPAYKNMSRQQLEDAIELGEKLAHGEADLVALDENSLALRGKKSKLWRSIEPSASKRKASEKETMGSPEKKEAEASSNEDQGARKRPKRPAKPSKSDCGRA